MVSSGGTAILALNDPARRNALSLPMREALRNRLSAAVESSECLGIVITGAAGAFCSGGDVRQEWQGSEGESEARRHRLQILHDIVRMIVRAPKPIVAAVGGSAFGAGLSLAMACDYVIAADTASFCASFTKVGLLPDCGLLWSLPLRVGMGRARELVLSARLLNAEAALKVGLIEEAVPAERLLPAAIERARELSANAPLAAAACKAILAKAPATLDTVLEMESQLQPALAASADCAEGKAAFFERRSPIFRGR